MTGKSLHGDGDAHSSENNARVEINIGVQTPLDKVLIAGGHMLKLHGNLQQLVSAEKYKHGVGASQPVQGADESRGHAQLPEQLH